MQVIIKNSLKKKRKLARQCCLIDGDFEDFKKELIKVNNLNTFRIIQIKEKFGGLRFYINGAPPNSKIYDIIDKYEDLSFEICEFCGAPGKTEDYQGWLFTWCKNCKNKIKNRK